MENLKDLLLPLLGLVFGYAIYQKFKRNSAEGILENQDTVKAADKLDAKAEANKALLESEEAKREEIKKDIEADKEAPMNLDELAKFFKDTNK